MYRPRTFVCDCGGHITAPVPKKCPHCGAPIAGVRRSGAWQPFILIAGLFAALLAFGWLLLRWIE